MSEPEASFTYRDAGVDIDAQDAALERIKAHVARTATPGVLSGVGSFGGLFRLPKDDYADPVLVSSTDGVGTKLKIALALDRHDTVGRDIVNHCVNDILVTGARPLFFLDYIGTGVVRPEVIEAVVRGLADGCAENGMALIGGEIAEMPDVYAEGEYDLVGTIVGAVDRGAILEGRTVEAGDRLIGLASDGLHTNGYTLVRKLLLERMGLPLDDDPAGLGRPLGEELLRVHRSYLEPVTKLRSEVEVRALAHITGGGLLDNVPRVLPAGHGAVVRLGAWPVPPIFSLVCREAKLGDAEAHRTFNMGVGLVAIVPAGDAARARALLEEAGLGGFDLGEVVAGEEGVRLVPTA
jgi:phosphoribosylformylglycinamidine cyclo-ligase